MKKRTTFVGNGPFKLAEWKHDESFTMVKSDTYWDRDTVKLDKVTWAMVDDRNTDYQMFESNELDTAYVPAEMSEKLMGSDEVKVFDQAGLYFYRFNVNKEPFQNEKSEKRLRWPSISRKSSITSRKTVKNRHADLCLRESKGRTARIFARKAAICSNITPMKRNSRRKRHEGGKLRKGARRYLDIQHKTGA